MTCNLFADRLPNTMWQAEGNIHAQVGEGSESSAATVETRRATVAQRRGPSRGGAVRGRDAYDRQHLDPGSGMGWPGGVEGRGSRSTRSAEQGATRRGTPNAAERCACRRLPDRLVDTLAGWSADRAVHASEDLGAQGKDAGSSVSLRLAPGLGHCRHYLPLLPLPSVSGRHQRTSGHRVPVRARPADTATTAGHLGRCGDPSLRARARVPRDAQGCGASRSAPAVRSRAQPRRAHLGALEASRAAQPLRHQHDRPEDLDPRATALGATSPHTGVSGLAAGQVNALRLPSNYASLNRRIEKEV